MLAFPFLEALGQQQISYPIGPIGTTWEKFLSSRHILERCITQPDGSLREIKLGTHSHTHGWGRPCAFVMGLGSSGKEGVAHLVSVP